MRMYKENIWHPVSFQNMVAFIGNSEYLWGCPEMPKCPFASFHLFPILFFLASSWATSCSLFRLLLVFAISLFSTFKNIYLSYPKKKKSVPVTFSHYLLCLPVQLEIGKIPLHAFGYSTCPHPRHTHILSTVHYWFRNKEILWSLMNYHSQYRWPIPSVT